MGRLNTIVTEACEGLEEVDGDLIQRETLKNLYDGVALKDVNTALVMTARTLVEREPNYSFVTRSEEHTSELQSLMRISYAVFCLKKKINTQMHHTEISI